MMKIRKGVDFKKLLGKRAGLMDMYCGKDRTIEMRMVVTALLKDKANERRRKGGKQRQKNESQS
ncbi:MAG: hypothetical protein IPJ86_07310 [Bacteroidetes bacterium]|nr:hypothetical protein [Bacteroidota bacterium]